MIKMNILIPMAGFGTRFQKDYPEAIKPVIDIKGKPMFQWAVESMGLKGILYFSILEEHDKSHNLSSRIKEIYPESTIIRLKRMLRGAAETCLVSSMNMDQSLPLVIFNCDQIIKYDQNKFLTFIEMSKCDGCVITFPSDETCFSYAKQSAGRISEIAEKRVISNEALAGLHYWKKTHSFCDSALTLVKQEETTNGEFYVAPTYNYLIQAGQNIQSFKIDQDQFISMGTPEQLRSNWNRITLDTST